MKSKKISIPSELKGIKPVVEELTGLVSGANISESDIFDIRLCMEEALINAIKYGNKFDRRLKVFIEFKYDDNKITVSIEDEGRGFDYGRLPDPTKEENLLAGNGRGVFIIRHLMDELRFNKKGNRLTMVKYVYRTDKRRKAKVQGG